MHKVDFNKVKTFPLAERKNKVDVADFVRLDAPVLECFPKILAGKEFHECVEALEKAAREKKTIILMLGAHVIKCGLSPMVIDLVHRGIITHVAMNGAGSIHDFEVAFQGKTSEDVATNLEDGTFGMADETGKYIMEALKQSDAGYGSAVGKKIIEMNLPQQEYSILAACVKKNVPVTIHSAIGTEIIHQHPACDGAALGRTSYHDFKTMIDTISTLEDGVVLNFGSAVILPEVFLKALTVARNVGYKVEKFTAINLDMIRHYRPQVNVVERPTSKGGKGYHLVGMHEIMIPLLYHALLQKLGKEWHT